MAGKKFRFGPIPLTTTLTTNLLNPPLLDGATGVGVSAVGTYIEIKHLRVLNSSASQRTFSLYLGDSAANDAGTEVMGAGYPVDANKAVDFYPAGMRMEAADFLVGGADANGALVISGVCEIGVA